MTPDMDEVEPDLGRARDFLQQSRRFLDDADREATSPESRVVLYWSACISAMDAVLAAGGWRVGRGEGAHAARVVASRRLFEPGAAELFDRLDEWRRERHDVSYAAITPSQADVVAMQEDARDVLELARRYVTGSTRAQRS